MMSKEKQAMGSSKPDVPSAEKGKKSAKMPGDGDDVLMKSLKQHDGAFNSLLSLIPAQFYLAVDAETSSASDEMKGISTKYMKNKRKQDKAVEAAEKKKHIKEAKRAKLDPDNFKSIAQIQEERAAAKRVSRASSDEMELDMDDEQISGARGGDTDSEQEEDEEEEGEEDGDSFATQLTSMKSSEEAIEDKPATNGQPPNGILDLRARLQAKIQGLQSKRRAPTLADGGVDGVPDDESVASTKDELLEERRKKRGDMRDKRRLAMKERRRAERESSAKGTPAGNTKKGGNAGGTSNGGNATKAPALLVPDRNTASNGASGSRAYAGPDSGDLAYSSLHFEDGEGAKGKKNRHTLPSDPKAALAVLESRKKKEEARAAKRGEQGSSESDVKAADLERKERERWSKAEAAAQGIKIRDDEGLLKKAAKRKEKVKDKSRKEWTDREKDQKDQASARIKKRNDNLAARKERSKKGGKGIGGKKMGGGGKKTKARPGFEGQRRTKPSGKPQRAKGSGK